MRKCLFFKSEPANLRKRNRSAAHSARPLRSAKTSAAENG